MKVYLAMDKIFGSVLKVCATKEIAEREIQKKIEYYTFPGSKHIAKRNQYYIDEVEVLND